MISESPHQHQKYTVAFIYVPLPLIKASNNFPEVRHFVDNSGRLSDITPTS